MRLPVTILLVFMLQVSSLLAGPAIEDSKNMKKEELIKEELGDQSDSGSGTAVDEDYKDEEYINSLLPKEKTELLYGGDIKLTPKQKEMITEMEKQQREHSVEKRAVVRSIRDLWPNGVVPYAISSRLGTAARNAISAAISQYHADTCVRFVRRTTQRDYVYFIRDNGCYSYIGRTGGRQFISLDRGCESKGIVMHELFHALGRWHEQSRPDRNRYIRVNYENIRRGAEQNFERLTDFKADTNGIAYDIRSIMHYRAYAFTKNGSPTIVSVTPGVRLWDIGQRSGFTDKDRQHVLQLYCNSQPVGTWTAWSQWGSCSVTCGSGTQVRTRTCLRGNCVGANRQTRRCTRNACPSWGPWSRWGSCSASCGGGRQVRTRSCQGGSGCSGSSVESQVCAQQPCPGVWSGWFAWGSCSKECGAGTQTRTRRCNGGVCGGASTQERECVKAPLCLQASGQWSAWGEWSQCSASCGFGGTQTRTRTCRGTACVGLAKEVRKCNLGTCPELSPDRNWGEWGAWGPCSRSCGTGYQNRRRRCLPGRRCRGFTFQFRGCNYDSCSQPVAPIIVAPQQVPYNAGVHTRLSCREVNIRRGVTDLHTLNDNPFTSNIVRSCVDLAAQNGFHYVGVTGGYCNSGSDNEGSYTNLPASTRCVGGTGLLNPTSLTAYMDVYRITPQ